MSESILEAITNLQLELSKAKARFRVKNECLQIAIGALEYIKDALPGATEMAISALDDIEELLAKLEYI